MSTVNIFKDSLNIIKNNIIIIFPPIIVTLLAAIIAGLLIGGNMPTIETMSPEAVKPEAAPPQIKEMMGALFLTSILSFFLHVFSQGMIISMAIDVLEKGSCSLQRGFSATLSKLNGLMISALIILILIVIGMMLLFLPALIVSFVFMFTFAIVMSEETGAINALKKSFNTVKENLGQTLVLFISLLVIGFFIIIINTMFSRIPFLGQIISSLLMGGFMSFLAVSVLMAYKELKSGVVVERLD